MSITASDYQSLKHQIKGLEEIVADYQYIASVFATWLLPAKDVYDELKK